MNKTRFSSLVFFIQITFFFISIIIFLLPLITEGKITLSLMNLEILLPLFAGKIKFTFLSYILIVIIIGEIIFGRIFCGFICPLGTLITIFDKILSPVRRKIKFNLSSKLNKSLSFLPLFILLLLLILKYFKYNLTGFFSPLAIINRFFILVLLPFLNSIFQFHYKVHEITLIDFTIFGILILSIFKERFWCRFLCPAGIIHRALSFFAIFKRKVESCTNCMLCTHVCPTSAIDKDNPEKYDKTMCLLCFKCVDMCPSSTRFVFQLPGSLFKINKKSTIKKNSALYKEQRRAFLKIITGAFITISFGFKIESKLYKKRKLFPPGATEESITKKCIRCLECIKVCPTGVLRPSKDGVNLFTPEYRPDKGYCAYECNLCGRVCPTEAIKSLSIEKKKKWKVGVAKVLRDLCVVWSKGIPCLICEEHCPVPEKAIKIKYITRNGGRAKAPVVEPSLCIGCGLCQNKCPVPGSAIRVYPEL